MAKIITNGDRGGKINGTGKADTIDGLGGNDRIGGHDGNDTIDGGIGNDKMHGGKGLDTLTGGSGDDWFVFKEFGKKTADTITDFKHGDDSLHLDLFEFTKLHEGTLANSEFHLGTKAHDTNDHIIYDKETGNLYYDDDGTGHHKQQLFATLENHAKLTASDIVMFFD